MGFVCHQSLPVVVIESRGAATTLKSAAERSGGVENVTKFGDECFHERLSG